MLEKNCVGREILKIESHRERDKENESQRNREIENGDRERVFGLRISTKLLFLTE